ncbi:MAG: M6 family metalloprotease domain-containing protein [Paludibacter sp.]|nr:M6 family metalloprotease domain-containing protein [Paludibacter sp.]
MKTDSAKILFLIVLLFSFTQLFAIPASPYPITVTQSNGTVLKVRLRGDEYFNYKTTLDGYALVLDADGILNYAQLNSNGQLKSTNIKASNIEKRSALEKRTISKLIPNLDFTAQIQASRSKRMSSPVFKTIGQKTYPLIGSPKSIVILVNFSDLSFVTPNTKTSFTSLLNQNGYSANGGTGSANNYFKDNSMGVFSPEFDVVGPYNLPGTMASYGANDANGNDVSPQQMVIDACAAASAAGVDFSQYDTDKNGVVDNVFIYYAGYNEAEGGPANSVWPHRWSLNNYSTKFSGVSIFGYACTSELRGSSGSNMCGIGTFCHEFGHVLGLDDMYATNSATHHTLSLWDIMDYGPYLNSGRTPCAYSSYERFFLNWLVPTELKTAGDYALDTLTTSNKAYLISQYGNHNLNGSNPSPVEFFMLDNRQKKGWDAYLPGHGMLITHIYYNASTWAGNTPNNDPNAMGVDIVEADGSAVSETTTIDPTLSGDPFPGTSSVTAYNPTLRGNINIHKPLLNIKETAGKITFHFASNVFLTQSLQAFATVQGTPSAAQTVTVSGTKLKAPISVSFTTGTHFEMKKASDTTWGKTLTLTPGIDSTLAVTNIQIRYNPTIPSYSTTHTETLVLTSGTDYADAALSGTSTRPVYVVPPVAVAATDTTFTSFVAKWNNVFDATGYYVTVYNISDGESTLSEGFDKGLVESPDWTITASTTSSSTVYSGTSAPSLQFTNSKEYVETEKYLLPVTSLSFFIRSLTGNNGGFKVEGMNELNVWSKIDSIPVTSSLNGIKNYSFTEAQDYVRFRFTYTKGLGYVTFDDVTAGFKKQLNYNLHEKWMTNTFDTLTNLIPNTDYFYKVRASDKSANYENITAFSNIINVKTLEYPSKRKLQTKVKDGNVTIYLPNLTFNLYVYNLLGQCVKIVTPESTTFDISDLPKNQAYILKSDRLITKIAL